MSRAIDEWCASLVAKKRDEAYVARCRAYLTLVGQRWPTPMDAIPPKVERLLLDLRASRSAKTANNARGYLRGFFEYCKRQGWVAVNPVQIPPFENTAPVRRRALTVDELRRLLSCDTIPAERRRVYGILAYTGLRAGELARLTWSNVDVASGSIHVPASIAKSGRDEAVLFSGPIGVRIQDVVRSTRGGDRTEAGGSEMSLRLADVPRSRDFRRDIERAGIQRRDARNRVAVLHSLRHTFCSLVRRAGASDAQTRALMRHADSSVTGRYTDEALLELRGVVERLEVA